MKIKYLLAAVACLSFLGCCGSAQANDLAELELPVTLSYQDPQPTWPWSLSGFYSFNRAEWSLVASHHFDTLWSNLGGRGIDVEIVGIVGGNAGSMLAGGAIQFTAPIHPRIRLSLGLGVVKHGVGVESFFVSMDGFDFGVVGSIVYQVRF